MISVDPSYQEAERAKKEKEADEEKRLARRAMIDIFIFKSDDYYRKFGWHLKIPQFTEEDVLRRLRETGRI